MLARLACALAYAYAACKGSYVARERAVGEKAGWFVEHVCSYVCVRYCARVAEAETKARMPIPLKAIIEPAMMDKTIFSDICAPMCVCYAHTVSTALGQSFACSSATLAAMRNRLTERRRNRSTRATASSLCVRAYPRHGLSPRALLHVMHAVTRLRGRLLPSLLTGRKWSSVRALLLPQYTHAPSSRM